MKAVHFNTRTLGADFHKRHVAPWSPRWDLVTLGALLGLAGGPIAAALGLLILAINAALNLLGRPSHPNLQTTGSVLLVSIIPLLIFGAHCLDKLDERIDQQLRRNLATYLWENNIRLSEIKRLSTDTAHGYHFLVRNPDGWRHAVTVAFDYSVLALVQKQRRSALSVTSTFWLNCAERYLAKYLREMDGYLPGGQLTVSELSEDELLLATYWRD